MKTFKVKNSNGRIFTLELGTMFNGCIYEEEWFPEKRNDIFAVLCGKDFETAQKTELNDGNYPSPQIGDFIFVDFQQNGPWGDIWTNGPIVEVFDD